MRVSPVTRTSVTAIAEYTEAKKESPRSGAPTAAAPSPTAAGTPTATTTLFV